MNVTVLNCKIENARTVAGSGIIVDDKELVVAVGYTQTGEFGYFICWENIFTDVYSDEISFKKKVNERVYTEVLTEFNKLVETYKNK